jgi:hypothetical protein
MTQDQVIQSLKDYNLAMKAAFMRGRAISATNFTRAPEQKPVAIGKIKLANGAIVDLLDSDI